MKYEIGSLWHSKFENGQFELVAIDEKNQEIYIEKEGESARTFSIKTFEDCFYPLKKELQASIIYVVFTPNDKIYTIFNSKEKLINFIFETVHFKKGWYFEIEEVK